MDKLNKYIIVAATVLFLSCSENNTKAINNKTSSDSSNGGNSFPELLTLQTNNDSSFKLIQGIWASDTNSNAIFRIQKDSIYFVEHLGTPFKFKIAKDTLIIFYEDLVTKDIILKLNKDSLVYKTETGEIAHLYNRLK